MNKLFDAQSWRNRLTALGVILDLKPLPEEVSSEHNGTTIVDLEQSVSRAERNAQLFRETAGTFLPEMVCKNPECGKISTTLFSCHFCPECKDECAECYDLHMAAGHESDSSTGREQHQGIHLIGGRNAD